MRLKNCYLSALFTAAFGLFPLAGHANLIDNGTFDTDLSDWTIVMPDTTTGVTWASGTAHIGRPGTPGLAVFEQAFDIPVGSSALEISFDYEWQVNQPVSAEDEFTVTLFYEDLIGTVTEVVLFQGSDDGLFNTTVPFSTIVSLNTLSGVSPNATLQFMLDENNSPVGTRIELDNVSVVPVPEPATAILLGSALAGSSLRFRKRK